MIEMRLTDTENNNSVKPVVSVLVFQLTLIFFIHGVVSGSNQPDVRQAELPSETRAGLPNCRFGAITGDETQVDWLDDLGAGWYFSFTDWMPAAPNAAEFVPLVTISQLKGPNGEYLPGFAVNPPMTDTQLGQLIADRPGALWVLGNEVDRGPNPGQTNGGQGDTMPDMYAQGYYAVYNYVKSRDPDAQIAISSLVQVTPGRLQYLDLVWDAYIDNYGTTMPVDVWNMHLYVLPEVKPNGQPNGVANVALGTDPALGRKESGGNPALCPLITIYCVAEHDDMEVFKEQIIAMRTWMKEHGQQEKPLILSEYSILYPYSYNNGNCIIKDEYGNCFTAQRVTDFLNNTFDYLYNAVDPNLGYSKDGGRLIQQSLWFSINNQGSVGFVSDLVRNNSFTQPGQAFVSYVQALSNNVNLFVDGVSNLRIDSGGTGVASVELFVKIRNNGNVPPNTNFFVTFYKNPELTQPIATATVPGPGPNSEGMAGCARMVRTARVNWNNLQPGVHPFWVKIDSTNTVLETSESDNLGSGVVIIDGDQLFLPISLRK